ncbi:hypothetical protein MHYP_G00189150 [Metynnis hypsauchen]
MKPDLMKRSAQSQTGSFPLQSRRNLVGIRFVYNLMLSHICSRHPDSWTASAWSAGGLCRWCSGQQSERFSYRRWPSSPTKKSSGPAVQSDTAVEDVRGKRIPPSNLRG